MKRPAPMRAAWRKSSRSNGSGNCVEIAGLPTGIGIRDSKAPAQAVLVIAVGCWAALADAVKAGKLDLS